MPPRVSTPPQPARRARARGTGSVSRDGTGFRAEIALTTDEGRTRFRARFAEEHAAHDYLDGLIHRWSGSGAVPVSAATARSEWTVETWLRHWLEGAWGNLSESTRTGYESACRVHLIPQLGTKRLRHLGPEDMDDFRHYLASTSLSLRSQRHHWAVLRIALRVAIAQRVLTANPMLGVAGPARPTARSGRDRAYSPAEIDRLLATQPGCHHEEGYCRLRWLLALVYGVRQGEALALSWDSVHPKSSDVRIKAHAYRYSHRHGCGSARLVDGVRVFPCGRKRGAECPDRDPGPAMRILPGMKAHDVDSFRDLFLPEPMKKAFVDHRTEQRREKAIAGDRWKPGEGEYARLVFTNRFGEIVTDTTDRKAWKRVVRTAGLPMRRLHDARHSALSALAATTPLRELAEIAGHSSLATTSLYLHPDAQRSRQALTDALERREQGERDLV